MSGFCLLASQQRLSSAVDVRLGGLVVLVRGRGVEKGVPRMRLVRDLTCFSGAAFLIYGISV